MRMNPLGRAALAFALAFAAGPVFAATILGLYNTGNDGDNSRDDYWSLQVSTIPEYASGANPYVQAGAVHANWISTSSSAASRWITPDTNPLTSFDPTTAGSYTYTLQFALGAGDDPSTASFNGRWASDNNARIFLNGTDITPSANAGNYNTWTSFGSITSANFQSGLNTLAFVVTNDALSNGNPTGLRVEFLSSSVAPVPEPHEWAMMLSGLSMIGFIAARRRKSANS